MTHLRGGTMKADFRLDGGDFCSTTCTVEPLSEKGKVLFAEIFGQGAVSATLRKSAVLTSPGSPAQGLIVEAELTPTRRRSGLVIEKGA